MYLILMLETLLALQLPPLQTGTFEFPLVVTAVMFQCIHCCGGKFIRFCEGGFEVFVLC